MRPSGWNVLCAAIAGIAVAACCTGCSTLNVGDRTPPAWSIEVQVNAPSTGWDGEFRTIQAGQQGVWQIAWDGGTPPYEVRIDFGDVVADSHPGGVVATFGSSLDVVATLEPLGPSLEATPQFSVHVEDSSGRVGLAGFPYVLSGAGRMQ